MDLNANGDAAGNTIQFQNLPGNRPTITLTSVALPWINKSVAIMGLGRDILTVTRSGVAGTPNFRIFGITGGNNNVVVISAMTISNGREPFSWGAGIRNHGRLTLDNVRITGNSASTGAGVFSQMGSLIITNSVIEGNTSALNGGGVEILQGTATIDANSVISGNSAANDGGGIYIRNAQVTVINSSIRGNNAVNGGAGIAIERSAIAIEGSPATLTVTGGSISSNTIAEDNNNPQRFGGGISNHLGSVTIAGTTISGNTAHFGGGVATWGGSVTMAGVGTTISGNNARNDGGGIFNQGGRLTLGASLISGNLAPNGNGGGILNSGANARLQFNNTTINNNTSQRGGAVSNQNGAPAAQGNTNGVISRNRATAPDGTGLAGGVYVEPGSFFSLANMIIADNTDDVGSPDVSGVFNDLGHNLIGITDGSSGWGLSTLLGSAEDPLDPKLNPLGWYGGPTKTMTLMWDSLAFNAGEEETEEDFDQRGYERLVGSAVDIGAVEMQPGEFTNNAPTAYDAAFAVLHGRTLIVPVESGLRNYASDLDNDLLYIVAIDDDSFWIGQPYITTLGGTLTMQADGSFVYVAPLNTIGIDTISFVVSDNYASVTRTLTINVTNNAPVVYDAVFSVLHDQALVVPSAAGLLAYAVDPDGDTPVLTAINGLTNWINIPLPTLLGGVVTVQADGSFVYLAPAATVGIDSLTFTVTDGIVSATATLTINVTNNAPVVYAAVFVTPYNETLFVPANAGLLAYTVEPDGDTPVLSAINNTPLAQGFVVIVSENGGALTVYADGSFEYIPGESSLYDDVFSFTISDGIAEVTATLTIHVTNA